MLLRGPVMLNKTGAPTGAVASTMKGMFSGYHRAYESLRSDFQGDVKVGRTGSWEWREVSFYSSGSLRYARERRGAGLGPLGPVPMEGFPFTLHGDESP